MELTSVKIISILPNLRKQSKTKKVIRRFSIIKNNRDNGITPIKIISN